MKEDWKECKLSEIMTLIGGGTPKTSNPDYWNGDIPWISVKDFNGERRYVIDTEKKITKLGLENSSTKLLSKGDIIISARGTVGELAIIPSDMAFNQSCYGLRAKEYVDSTFLYYLLKQSVSILQHNTHGSVFDTITRDTFDGITINLPPLATQQKIATILSSLDDKIELNNKINDNLEQQAQAIFKSWFVDFEPFGGKMPEEWRIGKVGDLGEIICGKTPSTKIKEYYGNECPFITIPDMHNNVYACFTERYLSKLGMESQIGKSLPVNSVCVSCIATPGLVILTDKISQTNQQINSIIPNKNMSSYYVYLLMQSLAETIKMLGSSGSTTSNLNKDQFSKIVVLIPAIYELKIFNSIVEPLFQNIRNNIHENQNLAFLRDTLLPKLLNGEIDVDEVKARK